MSTKSSILLTNEDEHWYIELGECDAGESRVYLEINHKSVSNITYDAKTGYIVALRGDSDLARILRGLDHFQEKE